jgi:hypothetical protein
VLATRLSTIKGLVAPVEGARADDMPQLDLGDMTSELSHACRPALECTHAVTRKLHLDIIRYFIIVQEMVSLSSECNFSRYMYIALLCSFLRVRV